MRFRRTPVFPYEPLVRVKHRSLKLTACRNGFITGIKSSNFDRDKARRIMQTSDGRAVIKFEAEEHNFDAAIYGARAAYISQVVLEVQRHMLEKNMVFLCWEPWHILLFQSFDSRYDAFLYYAKTYPESCTLLIDTYSTLKSGIKNAIKVAKDYLEPNGYRLKGVRIDSGDMAYLSKKVRKELDAAGLEDCQIVVSNSLDEYVITSLIHQQGAKIDSFGVGENLICSKNSPVFGGVYKLVAIEKDGKIIPKIKISDNVEKVTNPGLKKLYRIIDKETNMAQADLMALWDEELDESKDLTIYHPMSRWKYKVIPAGSYILKELLVPIFIRGEQVYEEPTLDEIRAYCAEQLEYIWEEIKRFEYPQEYYVDLTEKLLTLKLEMLNEYK